MPPAVETLADLPLRKLLDRLADGTPAPGGGSAAAVACSMAASLVFPPLPAANVPRTKRRCARLLVLSGGPVNLDCRYKR